MGRGGFFPIFFMIETDTLSYPVSIHHPPCKVLGREVGKMVAITDNMAK